MISPAATIPSSDQKVTRESLLVLLKTAIETGAYRFARQAAFSWLSTFPGDLEINLLLATAQIKENKITQALPNLEKICRLDPEFLDAHELIASASDGAYPNQFNTAAAFAGSLSARSPYSGNAPVWAGVLRSTRRAIQNHSFDEAENYLRQAYNQGADDIFTAIAHLEITQNTEDALSIYRLADLYRGRWPECLQFLLIQADAMLKNNQEAPAVALLHQCAAADAAGQVPERLWGKNFPYRPLWPSKMEMYFNQPVPAEVAARLGRNLLTIGNESTSTGPAANEEAINLESRKRESMTISVTGNGSEVSIVREEELILRQPASAKNNPAAVDDLSAMLPSESELTKGAIPAASQLPSQPTVEKPQPAPDSARSETLPTENHDTEEIHGELERIAQHINQPGAGSGDGRYPVYIILSTWQGLGKKYGEQGRETIQVELKKLHEVMKKKPGWESILFLPDQTSADWPNPLDAKESNDPWKLKLSLADLDKTLAKKGQMVGAVLIAGGPDVVPFHNLPNPTDDSDTDVPSDNPYGTTDANYFITEWPVGRLPGETGSNPQMLLEQIQQVASHHSQVNASAARKSKLGPVSDFFQNFRSLFDFLRKPSNVNSFGYSAAVWRRPSQFVYKNIGQATNFLASPPESSGSFNSSRVTGAQLAYFNLHGMADASDWYGQRDRFDPLPGPDYPVAISPKDLIKNGKSPRIVFTEACYGGHISEKTRDTSLALKFKSLGVNALVGSTRISYGSVGLPLIGADLLAFFFWKHHRQGEPVGMSLLHSRMDVTQEMNKRQGYLDGEDQKTLISFVLYGDPLFVTEGNMTKNKKAVRKHSTMEIKTVCDRQNDNAAPQRLSGEVLKQVKEVVEAYLPGLENAQIRIAQQHTSCDGKGHRCPSADLGLKTAMNDSSQRVLVTISKQVQVAQRIHRHYARVTLDNKGHVVKLALSR